MIVIEGKIASGKSTELIKRFIEDEFSSMLITDEMTLESIINTINKLKEQRSYVSDSQKLIKTEQYTNCNADYFSMLTHDIVENIYIDIHFSNDFFNKIKDYCLELEKEYGYKFTLVRQLSKDSGYEGLNIIEIEV